MPKNEKPTVRETIEITDEVLAEVIDLARLDPLEPGMSLQKQHLKNILDHFRILRQVEVEGVDPTIQVNPTPIPLRPDEVIDWLSPAESLANARLATGQFFRSPRIIGGEESEEA